MQNLHVKTQDFICLEKLKTDVKTHLVQRYSHYLLSMNSTALS